MFSSSEDFQVFSCVFQFWRGRHRSSGSQFLGTDGMGKKSALWQCLNLGWILWAALLSSGGLFSLEGVFWGHSMIFLLVVVAQLSPWRSPGEIFSGFGEV